MAKKKANTAATEKTQHSPGPWAFTEGDAERRASSTVYKANDKEFRIAEVMCEWANQHQRAEDIANAWLIASAPDLLAACVAFREYTTTDVNSLPDHGEELQERCAKLLKVALAKAGV